MEQEIYSKTRVYFFPNNLKSIDTLWEKELDDIKAKNSFTAKIISISDSNVVVEPIESEKERSSSDRISFSSNGLADIDASAGSYVRITYIGEIAESYPAQINAIAWEITNDLRTIDYTESYINKETSEKKDGEETEKIKITRIYKNCFFAKKVSSFYQEIKLNGSLPEKWCVNDLVNCTYKNNADYIKPISIIQSAAFFKFDALHQTYKVQLKSLHRSSHRENRSRCSQN